MKMAKASTADIEMAMELSRFIEDLVDGMCPKQACEDPESDDIEWLEDDPDEQHIRIISALQGIARKGSIFRVTFGMSVLIDPRNELVDPAADTLEPHPKLEKLAESNAELLKLLAASAKELQSCQAVIHLRGGFDPAYVKDAQKVLKQIDAAIAKAEPKGNTP